METNEANLSYETFKSTTSQRKRKSCENFTPDLFSSTQVDISDNLRDLLIKSTPHTPNKHSKPYQRSIAPSPIQESRSLLYKNLKKVKPKQKLNFHRHSVRSETFLFLKEVTSNQVVMQKVFEYLSDGDLFRLNKVSRDFRMAIQSNNAVNVRRLNYEQIYRFNKENYVITPPNSPGKCDSPPRTGSSTLDTFIRIGRFLHQGQKLTKCRSCSFPAVQENELCQCQNQTCSLIYCIKCNSSSANFEDFVDKCGNSELQPFSNLSNCSPMSDSGFFSSGLASSGSISTPLRSQKLVKRTLFPNDSGVALALNNSAKSTEVPKPRRSVNMVRVVPGCNNSKEKRESVSPSPVKSYAACSKQSKRNLKRLTR